MGTSPNLRAPVMVRSKSRGYMSLKPVLGFAQLLFYSIGVIVGAGVYSVIGAAAGLAGLGGHIVQRGGRDLRQGDHVIQEG